MIPPVDWFVQRYLAPHFSLQEKCRNGFVVTSFVVWLTVLVSSIIAYGTRGLTWDVIYLRMPSNFILVATPFGLLKAHSQDCVSDGVMTFLVHCASISVTLGTLFFHPTHPEGQHLILILFLIPAANLPLWVAQCFLLLPGYVIQMYNLIAIPMNYQLIHALNEPEVTAVSEWFSHVRLLILIPLTLVLIHAQIEAYRSATRKLESAVKMAKLVSEYLAEYNTKEAEDVLIAYSSETLHIGKNEYDVDLHDVLLVIVGNLKKYRPFIPNYILTDSADTEDDAVPSSPPGGEVGRKNGGDSSDSGSGSDEKDKELGTVVVTALKSSGSNTFIPPETLKEDNQKSLSKTKKTKSTPLLAMIPTRRTVSYALIDYTVVTDDVIDNPHTLRDFIDRVYRYANMTSGAIHSCVGNTLHMTWNATRPVSTPESCASGVFHGLMTYGFFGMRDVVESSRVVVNGSVMTGVGECRMTGTIHQAFLLDISWRDAQVALHRLARYLHAKLLCKATTLRSQDCDFVPINVMLPDMYVTTTNCIEVYEIVDWETKQAYSKVLHKIIELMLDRNYSCALECLERFDDGVGSGCTESQMVNGGDVVDPPRGWNFLKQKLRDCSRVQM